MKKAILTLFFSFTAIAGIFAFLVFPDAEIDFREVLMVAGAALVIGFGLFIGIRRFRDARKNLPVEDEMSKRIMKSTGATAYYISLYLWLALMMFESQFSLERSSFIGMGILGMAIIFALSWVYHSYFSRKHE